MVGNYFLSGIEWLFLKIIFSLVTANIGGQLSISNRVPYSLYRKHFLFTFDVLHFLACTDSELTSETMDPF
jgi:hypothetical protein